MYPRCPFDLPMNCPLIRYFLPNLRVPSCLPKSVRGNEGKRSLNHAVAVLRAFGFEFTTSAHGSRPVLAGNSMRFHRSPPPLRALFEHKQTIVPALPWMRNPMLSPLVQVSKP